MQPMFSGSHLYSALFLQFVGGFFGEKVLCDCLICILLFALSVPCFATDYPQFAPDQDDYSNIQYALWDNGFVFEGVFYELVLPVQVQRFYPFAIWQNGLNVYIFYYDLSQDQIGDTYFELNPNEGTFSPFIRFVRYDIQSDGTLKHIGSTSSAPFNTWLNIETARSCVKFSRIDILWKDTYNAPHPFVSANDGPLFYPQFLSVSDGLFFALLIMLLMAAVVLIFFRW